MEEQKKNKTASAVEKITSRFLPGDRVLAIIVILGLIGILLIFISTYIKPSSYGSRAETEESEELTADELEKYRSALSEELGNMLASMNGVGRTKVMITIGGTARNVYATDTDVNGRETSRKSGDDENGDRQSNEKKTFSALAINIPEKCKNISNNATAKVTLDLSGLSKKTFDVDTFKVEGLSSDFKAEVTSKSISVTVIGPESELSDLSADSITAQIDVTDSNLKTGSVEMPVTFKFSGVNGCWAYGSYRANLNISESK